MGKNDFKADKKIGDLAEQAVIEIFSKIGLCEKAERGEVGYDIAVSFFSKDPPLSAPENTALETETATGAVTLTIVAPPNEKD